MKVAILDTILRPYITNQYKPRANKFRIFVSNSLEIVYVI